MPHGRPSHESHPVFAVSAHDELFREGLGSVEIVDHMVFEKESSFETALTTHSGVRQTAPDRLEFSQSGRTFTAEITTPAKTDGELEVEFAKLKGMILDNLQHGRLMVASSPSSEAPKVPSLSWNHAYAVIRLDPQTDMVTIRDPHGQTFKPKGEPGLTNGYEVRNGYFSAPLGEMVRFMSTFSFEQSTPRKTLAKSAK